MAPNVYLFTLLRSFTRFFYSLDDGNQQDIFSQEDVVYPEVFSNQVRSRADKLKLYDILVRMEQDKW